MNFVGVGGSSVLTEKSVLEEAGLFDESMHGAEDWDLWIRIARTRKVYSLNEYLVRYRFRPGQSSRNAPRMTEGLRRLCSKVLASESESGAMDRRARRRLIQRYGFEIADLWKSAAYTRLFKDGDAKTFRAYIRNGLKSDRSQFGWKVWVYYLLSFVSVPLCRRIKKLKKTDRAAEFPDKVCDVKDLRF